MITTYAAEIGHWEEWAQAYRYGVLLIFPPDPLMGQVNALRARHDPRSAATCAAHISLTVPLPRPMDVMHWRELEAITASIEPFAIRHGPLMNLGPVVCLAIQPQDQLDKLRIVLESATVFTGAMAHRYPFLAHMTIAEFISAAQTETLLQELESIAPTGVFTCTRVAYAVPDVNFHFTERMWLNLAASPGSR